MHDRDGVCVHGALVHYLLASARIVQVVDADFASYYGTKRLLVIDVHIAISSFLLSDVKSDGLGLIKNVGQSYSCFSIWPVKAIKPELIPDSGQLARVLDSFNQILALRSV